MNKQIISRNLRVVVVFLSFLCTPWLIFMSSCLPLYIKNQEDLYYHYPVIIPFLVLTIITTLSGLAIFYLQKSFRQLHLLKPVIAAYLILGPTYVFVVFTDSFGLSIIPRLAIIVLILLSGSLVVYKLRKKLNIENIIPFFALLGVLFSAADIIYFSTSIKYYDPQLSHHVNPDGNPVNYEGKNTLPNIYHVILDEFQSEMLTVNLDKNLEEDLSGFTFFPGTTSVYGRTGMSIPSIFLGKPYDMNSRQIDYQKAAFNSEESFLHILKNSGYVTNAFLHGIFKFNRNLLDSITVHKNLGKYNTETLFNSVYKLWVHSEFPTIVSSYLIGSDQVGQFDLQNQLDSNSHILSLRSFQYMLNQESNLIENNRYTYSHLIIPHFPYVLSSECDYLGNDEGSSPKQQTLCAIKLMRDLIHKLKSLGRFKDSLIIFQGDHGARFVIKDNELVDVRLLNKKLDAYSPEYSHARSRSLLLIKPAGIGADTNLIVSNKPAELTDIAATLLTSVNLRKPLGMKGVNLFDEQISIQDRTRNYYFYDKLRRIGWTDKMMHYQIHRDVITKMGTITLENNKRTTLLDLVETKTKN
jgi:hypothetical protein